MNTTQEAATLILTCIAMIRLILSVFKDKDMPSATSPLSEQWLWAIKDVRYQVCWLLLIGWIVITYLL